ncbi:MAG: SBBP repeat-containing protein [Flavobacteriales bacterium]|nr:SBBP repeat-containing protein [Flavobacteriales bacterium]MBP9081097.1 SBBP repeat-containing protein [Flavobacteriales bacterium]
MKQSLACLVFLLMQALLPAHAQQWNWATSGGGTSNDDFCQAIATDSQGNVYYAGTTRGSNGQFACGAVDVGATTGAVLAKYNAQGVCQWLRSITVPSFEARAYAIAVDAQDRIYLAGSFRGTATFSNGIALASNGGTGIFLARYDTAGTCLWARSAGGNNATSEARGIALSADGGIFIAGKAGGNPVLAGDLQLANPGNYRQVFLARYDSTGNAQWARISSGSGNEKSGRGISIQGNRLFATGQASYAATTFDGLSLTNTSTSGNLYVMACDLLGNAQWARSYSGLATVEGTGIAADSLGNLFVAGSLWGSLNVPGDTLQSVGNDDDILLLGLDQQGNHRWGHSAGSAERDLAWAVTADGMGNAYVAMQFEYSMDLLGQAFTALGDEDALIMKLRADGTPVWSSRPSGFQRDIALCIHRQAEAPHRLFFGGYFWGAITYGSSTVDDVQNGDGMLVSGMDTTFAVNIHATPACPGDCNGTRTAFINGDGPFDVLWGDGSTGFALDDQCAGGLEATVTDAHGQSIIIASTVPTGAPPGLTVQVQLDSLWLEGGTDWQWYFNGSPIAGADSSSHIAAFTGQYHATYNGPSGCRWSSDTVTLVLGVGMHPADAASLPLLYPNPATDRLWVYGSTAIASATGRDLTGREVQVPVVEGRELSTAHLAPGPWILELRFADGRAGRWKVVKAMR